MIKLLIAVGIGLVVAVFLVLWVCTDAPNDFYESQ